MEGELWKNRGSTRRRILLVEDEELVYDLLRIILDRPEYSLLHARSADEALELVAGLAGPLDLAITDLGLAGVSGSGMDGCAMVTRLLATHPETSILFISGDPAPPPVVPAPRNGVTFLHKPFRPAQLLAQVEQALGK